MDEDEEGKMLMLQVSQIVSLPPPGLPLLYSAGMGASRMEGMECQTDGKWGGMTLSGTGVRSGRHGADSCYQGVQRSARTRDVLHCWAAGSSGMVLSEGVHGTTGGMRAAGF